MSEEKVRVSGEKERPEQAEPILPTVNPAVAAAQEPKKPGLHPSVYIAYVEQHTKGSRIGIMLTRQ
jgi:hypothetical protein